jgi:IPT/TIG domain
VRRIATLLALVAAGTLACQDTLGPLLVTSLTLKPTADTLGLGQAVILRLTLQRAAGDTVTGLHIDWTTSDTGVVALDTTGYAIAVGIGTATVRAVVGVQSATATILVTDSAPTITRVSPPIGTAGTRLAIYGTHFRPGAAILLDTLAADSVAVVTDTLITASVPAGVTKAGESYVLTVRNVDGSKALRSTGFTVSAPILRFLNGASAPAGAIGAAVVLEGRAFGDQQGDAQVFFSDGAGGTIQATIARPSDWTNTAIATVVPSGAATGPVLVQTAAGTSDSVTFTIASPPTFAPQALAWTSATALPVGLSGHAAAMAAVGSAGQFVYVIGGADSSGVPRKDVLFSPLQSGGGLGDWTATTPLPTATAFAAAVIATPANSRISHRPGSIYVVGGITSAGGDPVATVFQGALNTDGSVMAWSGTGLPVALHSARAAIFRGDLYIAGGSMAGNVPVALVYRARIDSLGVLGPWRQEPSLPFARSYAGFGALGDYLYAFGGDSAAVTPDEANVASNGTKLSQIAYAKVDLLTGDLLNTSWTVNGGSLATAVSKHTAVLAGGTVLITGGLYQGAAADSTEERYAALNADGSVGAFTNATGTHTIVSAGGKALFNHAAVTYVDDGGVAHVIILGGDDVNAPGKKRAEVWIY